MATGQHATVDQRTITTSNERGDHSHIAEQPATDTCTPALVSSKGAFAGHDLPAITEHDLLEFHKSHFPGLAPPTTFFVDPSTIAHLLPPEIAQGITSGEEEEEEDDGLGYYPDGVKRTLTDAQIEIFRHSERIQLERERRLQKEKAESPAPTFDAHVALQAEYAAQQKQQQQKGDHTKVREQEIPYAERHKRKWEVYVESTDSRHGSITHRRLARELDGQSSENVAIDYGDDTSASEVGQSAVPPSRSVVSYADD